MGASLRFCCFTVGERAQSTRRKTLDFDLTGGGEDAEGIGRRRSLLSQSLVWRGRGELLESHRLVSGTGNAASHRFVVRRIERRRSPEGGFDGTEAGKGRAGTLIP